MIRVLDEQECFDLVRAQTVGRLGFVADGRVQVIPVNYLVDGRSVVVRTAPGGVLTRASDEDAQVAFEVDHHDNTGGHGWSVLMNGPLTSMTESELAEVEGVRRVVPWAGSERSLPLRLTIETVSGRQVVRMRNRPMP